MGKSDSVRRFTPRSGARSMKQAQAFMAERSAAVRRLSQPDIEAIEREAVAGVDKDQIVRDAQAHIEQLKQRSGRVVRRQQK